MSNCIDSLSVCCLASNGIVDTQHSGYYSVPYLLLQAEEFFSWGDLVSAKAAYNSAITYAKNHKAVHDEVLACELAGKCLLSMGDLQLSLEYLRMAHKKYDHRGSAKKAVLLFQFITEKFSDYVKFTRIP